MKKSWFVLVVSLVLLSVNAASAQVIRSSPGQAEARTAMDLMPSPVRLEVSSPAFKDGGDIPFENTQYRGNVFPGLSWTVAPKGTLSYVLIMQDNSILFRGAPVLHWTMINIPASVTQLAAAMESPPAGAGYGPNIRGASQPYMGPKTPPGPKDNYHFQIFALDTRVPAEASASYEVLEGAMKSHVLASGEIVGLGQMDPAAAPAAGAQNPSGEYFLYAGTLTDPPSTSRGIYAWRFDPSTMTLTALGLQARGNNFFDIQASPDGKTLYGGNWQFDADASYSDTISSFGREGHSGALRLLNMVDSKGLPTRDDHLRGGTNQVVLDPSGRIAIACNAVGTVVAFPVEKDGSLGQAFFSERHLNDGAVSHGVGHPVVGSMIHGAIFSPDSKLLYVSDLGLDRIYVYRVDPEKPSIQPFSTPFIALATGAGPRHFQMHPNGIFLYVNLEQAVGLKVFRIDEGRPSEIQSFSTLPPDWTGIKSSSEVLIDQTGRFLYVGNRGMKSSIAAYRVDQTTGLLTLIGFTPVDGVPSNLLIDPTNHFLLSSNEGSDTIVVFAIDATTGKLAPTSATARLNSPSAISLVPAS